ncbi:predicted protein, partial [Nematostella vectensis]
DPVRDKFEYGTFPADFEWGSATSAYQIEGAWDVDGKGLGLWDYLTHSHQFSHLFKNQTGDVACDSYHKYKEDVQLLRNLGVKAYRFSISWPRILPKGTKEIINTKGIEYYNNLINELLHYNIQPVATIYHWDLPVPFRMAGSWTNSSIIEHFNDYAEICFKNFGDRVKKWITINEPAIELLFMKTHWAPPASSREQYLAGHNLLLAHAKVYHTYNNTYKATQKGKISISLNGQGAEPLTDSQADKEAADRYMQFYVGHFAVPIYVSGDYPEIMKTLIANKSTAVGIPSRLPEFTEEQKKMIKGTADYFATNHYSSDLVQHHDFYNGAKTPQEMWTDGNYVLKGDPNWNRTAFNWAVVPWGLRKFLKYFKDNYGDPEVIITENGCSAPGEYLKTVPERLEDDFRVDFFNRYINEVYKAYKLDGVKVKGYYAWSLMDNFEWFQGYNMPFGIHFVNFTDPNRPRLPKKSAIFYKKIVAQNGFPGPSAAHSLATSRAKLEAGLVIISLILCVFLR